MDIHTHLICSYFLDLRLLAGLYRVYLQQYQRPNPFWAWERLQDDAFDSVLGGS